jgi:hypothetical protein
MAMEGGLNAPSVWSGWTESNRRYLFGREEFYH